MAYSQARPPLSRPDHAHQRQDIVLTTRQREQFASLRAYRFGLVFDQEGDADCGHDDDDDCGCEDDGAALDDDDHANWDNDNEVGEDIDGDHYANWDKDTEDPSDRQPDEWDDVDRDDFGYGEEDADERNAKEAAAMVNDTKSDMVPDRAFASQFNGSSATVIADQAGRPSAPASYAECDRVIRDAFGRLSDGGQALRRMRDYRLWRGSHRSWPAYLSSLENVYGVRVRSLIDDS